MRRAKKVKATNNYLLLIEFDNGEERVYNCLPLIMNNRIYKKLEDIQIFNSVHIDDMGVVCWDDATDINPYDLYQDSIDMSNFKFAVCS